MRRNFLLCFAVLSAFAFSSMLGGCGSSKKEGQDDVITTVQLQNAARLGDTNCLQCHNAGQDLTMVGSGDGRTIGEAWRNSLHHVDVNGIVTVHCEDCHGGGQFHWGLGPLAYPNPDANVCLKCHGSNPPAGTDTGFKNYTGYLHTAHANGDNLPDKFFFQGGTGTDQAENRGVPEFVAATSIPVTKNQHIEECSVCHNNNQRFVYASLSTATGGRDSTQGNLLKPDPNNMPTPQVSCASCHDAHQVGLPATAGTTEVDVPIFRKSQIAGAGAWNSPSLRIPQDPNLPATPEVFSTTELVCAACHTKGLYKYGRQQTHQENVYPQWSVSAHNDRTGVPFTEVSLTDYPLDMTQPGTSAPGRCVKCHNGISSISMMYPEPVTRRPAEPAVVWNQATAVCITCHDPHNNGAGHTDNVRTPGVMTNYSGAGTGIIYGNVFLDTQPVPANPENPNSTICIFCHQGRESGLTLFKDKLAAGRTITGPFKNNHYLGTAAMLWGANAYEYGKLRYTANFAHQDVNCTGCHMDNSTQPVNLGGHTWKPNPVSCNPCHSSITSTTSLSLEPGEGFLATHRATSDTTNYSGNTASVSIAQQIRDLQNYVLALLTANGVFYDDTQNPYFFNVPITVPDGSANNHGNANRFTAWTPDLYKAAFNIAIAVKANPSAESSTIYVLNGAGVRVPTTSQTLLPNKSAAVHNYKYVIELLIDSYTNLYNNSTPAERAAAQALINAGSTPLPLPAPATLNLKRPAGTRFAVNYGAYLGHPGFNPVVTYGGVYSPLQ